MRRLTKSYSTSPVANRAGLMPVESFFQKYPWVRKFSSDPGSPLGDLLARQINVHGEAMLPTVEIEQYLSTMKRLVEIAARRKRMN